MAAGHKPLGLADTDDVRQAHHWVEQAAARELACTMEQATFDECGGETVWFVSVARREAFSQLLDIDALCAWYRRALTAAGLVDRVSRATDALTGLANQAPADFLDRTDDLIMAPFLDDDPCAVSSEVTGLVLGYWPPTTVGMIARQADPSLDRYDVCRFPAWDRLRIAIEDSAPLGPHDLDISRSAPTMVRDERRGW